MLLKETTATLPEIWRLMDVNTLQSIYVGWTLVDKSESML